MKNILITGGTGFIGSTIAQHLLQNGCTVRVLRRQNSDLRTLEGLDIEHHIGDILDKRSLSTAVKGCDTIFHTAAIISYWRKERELMMRINVEGTRNIVETALQFGIEKFIHTSSIASIGLPKDGTIADESVPFNWHTYDIGYRISKFLAEKEIQKGIKLGLPAVIINPSIVIGPGDYRFNGGRFIRDIYRKKIFYYSQGGINVVCVNDVARGHLLAAQKGRIGERYVLGGENLSFKEFFSMIAQIVGGFKPRIKIPNATVYAAADISEFFSRLLSTRPSLTRELVAGIELYRFFSSAKAEKELGYKHTPIRECVKNAFVWYREKSLI